ncbi:MAG: bifunctional (p)ppGpp synthetase/guanosine-3',5'-bis(diphosphate) 3'-pyrophosphohydrolase [Oscillospiraceae bacterium]|nr:bifunctional (p)ppGpp synthetase/guanosine-3',5'-bis(diphosphate) 3'-pyrophosphohydrolase [Oscillospiraceae bacterium]
MEAEYRAILERRYQTLLGLARAYMPSLDERFLLEAFEFAVEAHSGQTRRSGEPFIIHPVEVAIIIAQMNMDIASIAAALLHDIIEDTKFTFADIKSRFGTTIAELVEAVSKLSRVNYPSLEEAQMENLRKMFLAMARDIRVIIIKIADRLHNMRTIAFQPERRRREISLETMEVYAPIAHRLGMQKIKWELEDVALGQLDPVGYGEIMHRLDEISAERGGFLEKTRNQIAQKLAEGGIKEPNIESRIKHVYSVYRKMMGQHKEITEIYDMYAFRVIVSDTSDCYNVLGLMHDLYRPIPGRFKDYISTPKPNMYRSLHTTVIGKEGQPFEIQIRTWEMHATAEYGIAAHWKYKQGIDRPDSSGAEEHLAWVRSLLESQQDTEAEDFIPAIKVDMFADEVFVFTPRGDVINLPAGAGPVDFAYSIHSAVGNRLSGAKVNGRIVSLDYRLESGDVVEVLTQNTHGPSRDWMKLVRTSEARSKIKQWFKKERREDNVVQGRAEFERELKRSGMTMAGVMQEDIFSLALKKMSFASADDLFAAIGYGGVSVRRVLGRLRDEIARQSRGKLTDEDLIEKTAAAAPKKPRTAVSGVIVEDLDNCLVKFAHCCAPVPGDPIIGYVTRGYGVSVHRRDCPNVIESLAADSGRSVRVSWCDGIKETFQSSLTARCHDRPGLLVDVMNALSAFKIKIHSVGAKSVADGFAIVGLRLVVENLEQLTHIMNRILQISGVLEVLRKDA